MNQNAEADRTVHPIGIEIHGGRAVVLIPAGSRTPVARAMTFTTVVDGQGAVEVRVVRCTGARAEPAHGPLTGRAAGVIGRFLVSGLRSAGRGQARVDIGISLDRHGVIRAWGADRHTGARQEAAFPGHWALPREARSRALARLARLLEARLEREGKMESGLRTEGRRLFERPGGNVGGPILTALAGELDALRRSAAKPPFEVS